MSGTDIHLCAEEVALRALTTADLDAVHALLSDWRVVRFMLLPHCTAIEQSRQCLIGLITEIAGEPWLSVARAIETATGELAGLCGIAVQRGSEQGEIWYLVSPDHWGHGIATQAARILLRICFLDMNLHHLFATCLPENGASIHVLEKLGMRRRGCEVGSLEIHGVRRDCYFYDLLRGEWEVMTKSAEMGSASLPELSEQSAEAHPAIRS